MVKPKFTPDPPPNIDGLPVEDQVRMLLDHMQRTHNRIEDWWPKDFENRIQALEGLVPYKIGPWVMVSLSSMDWVHEVYTKYAACGFNTATYSEEYSYGADISNYGVDKLYVSEDGVHAYGSKSGTGGPGAGIFHWEMSTPWAVSSMSYQDSWIKGSVAYGHSFAPDGKTIFVIDWEPNGSEDGQKSVSSYPLGTAWDLSTVGSRNGLVYVHAQTTQPISLCFTRNGEHFYFGRNVSLSKRIYQYDCSTAWNLSTASYVQFHDFTEPEVGAILSQINIDNAGANMYLKDFQDIAFVPLSTPYDVSTATYDRTINLSPTTFNGGMAVDEACAQMVVLDQTDKKMRTFDLS